MSDNLEIIKCPACDKEMTKVFIPSEGIHVDICLDGCGGMYFDNREYQCFDEQDESIDSILEAIKGREFSKVDDSLPRSCPVCGTKMVKHFASPKQKIKMDECYSCGGIFLDNDELIQIRNEYKSEQERSKNTQDLIASSGIYQELEKLAAENEQRKKNRSLFAKAFARIFDLY